MKVYEKIAAVSFALAASGIAKDRNNTQQGYKFRGIDDVYNALSKTLATHGLCILPRIISRECVERQTAKGNALFYVTICAEFDFVASEDGSKHTVVTYGEAMDSGDKATNKAMSAAYKYACMQAFCIPTEGDNDADSTTHEVVAIAMNEAQFADFMAAIEACTTVDGLTQIRADAKKAAGADVLSWNTIDKASRERKAAITKGG
jgi:hypothetical protein